MTVRGIEAIKMYMPPSNSKIDANVHEERGHSIKANTSNNNSMLLSSMERYNAEWRQLLADLKENPERIREAAFSGELKTRKFRSIYWAILLHVLNVNPSSWHIQCKMHRKRYEKLKNEFLHNPHQNEIPTDDNPLSQSQQSVWNQYFTDQELLAVIRQDVIRTFPGVDFFRKDLIQDAMTNILFNYAREHPYLSYRQGMHEILAPILFVIYSDQQSLLHLKEISGLQEIDSTLLDVLNSQFLEPDSYSIFSRVMSSIESYYRISNFSATSRQTSTVKDPSVPVATEVEVISQLNSIRDKLLAKEDIHLYNHLLKLEIPLHLFGIPWLRLLFGREFPLLDLLVLWDAIFADSDGFNLPKYILVAMLVHIRDKLLLQDYTTCLTHLMRYTVNVDVNIILQHALHMQMPQKFERPQMATGRDTKRVRSVPPKVIPQLVLQNTKVEHQIAVMQARNAFDIAAVDKLKVGPKEAGIIMDGHPENSPDLLRLELNNAQTVISIARDKLQFYLATIRHHIPPKLQADQIAQALNGIDEVCSFLDVKSMFPLHTRIRSPIDPAAEANNELLAKTQLKHPSRPIGNNGRRDNKETSQSSSHHDEIVNKSTDKFNAYEKPDVDYMRNTAKLLGQRKEIELQPIGTDECVAIIPPIRIDNVGVASEIGTETNNLPIISPFLLYQR